MTEEERNKEIEWLMGSIKRSAAGGSSMNFMFLFMYVILIAFGFVMMFFFDDANDNVALLVFLLGGASLISALFTHISHKRIARAETPQELIAAHDRMWIIQSVIIMFGIVVMAFLYKGNFLSKTCLVLSGLLMMVAGWLSMLQRLRLWVGIALLFAEGLLLYFSGINLLLVISLLLVMLSIIKGEKSLFTNKVSDNNEGLDEGDEQDFKRLRELVRESESSI